MPVLPGGEMQVYHGGYQPTAAPSVSPEEAAAPWKHAAGQAGQVLDFEDKVKKAQQAVQATQAGLDATKQLDDLALSFHTRGDYQNFDKDFAASSAKIRQGILTGITDPEVAQHFKQEFNRVDEEKRSAMGTLKVDKMQSAALAAADGITDDLPVSSAALSPLERDRRYSQGASYLDGLAHGGMLTPVQAEERKQKLRKNMDTQAASADIVNGNFDPERYPGMKPEDLLSLIGKDHEFKKQQQQDVQEKTGIDFTKRLQDHSLTQPDLDQAAGNGSLNYQQYKDFSSFVQGGDAQTQAPVFNAIVGTIAKGRDAGALISTAVAAKHLSMDDYVRAVNMNAQRDEKNPMGNPFNRAMTELSLYAGEGANDYDNSKAVKAANMKRDLTSWYAAQLQTGKAPEWKDMDGKVQDIARAYRAADMDAGDMPMPSIAPAGTTTLFSDGSGQRYQEQKAALAALRQINDRQFLDAYRGDADAAARDPEHIENEKRIQMIEGSIHIPKPKPAAGR